MKVSFMLGKNKILNYFEIGKCFAEYCFELCDFTEERAFQKFWNLYSEFDIFRSVVPKKYGGLEMSHSEIIDLMQGLGYGNGQVGVLFSVNVQLWAFIVPLLKFGNEELLQTYLPGLMSGKLIGSHAITEADAGSDVFQLKSVYEKVLNGYVLSGSKVFVTNIPVANLHMIYARRKESSGISGVSCFIVDEKKSDIQAISRGKKFGMPLSPIGDLYFENCFCSEEMRLGRESQGMMIFQYTMIHERVFLMAFQVGIMERQFDTCLHYAKIRKQGSEAIGEKQSVSNRIADMRVRLETSKLYLKHVVANMEKKRNLSLCSSIAKLVISENLYKNSIDALQNYGAMGYLNEYYATQQLLDSLGALVYSGTSDIQRNIIATMSLNKEEIDTCF